MSKILFINACARPISRTNELANCVLQHLEGEIEQINLYDIDLEPLNFANMQKRDRALKNNDFSDAFFNFANNFSNAEKIVIAAPYWDLMFPAVLRTYLENVSVCGITFRYSQEGRPIGMCKAQDLYFVTTSGGYIGGNNFGGDYIKSLSQNLFGINNYHQFNAEGLDIIINDAEAIMNKAKEDINLYFLK